MLDELIEVFVAVHNGQKYLKAKTDPGPEPTSLLQLPDCPNSPENSRPGCGYIRRHPGAVAPTLQRRHELLTYGEGVRAFSHLALAPKRPT